MLCREDERAVTVQIGAVLLLAILFSALALYQLNAVPVENEQVEFTHNQAVHDELQDLRNAMQNVGTNGGTQSTAVTLGTQYPARTVTMNPPAPTGSLETTGTQTVNIENAEFTGEGEYDGDPENLTGEHNTTTVAYVPDYNEYRSAPTTRIEHGFAYNDFGDAQVSLTGQPLLSDRTIRLVLLEGDLAESGSGAVSIDPTILSGPSDDVPIESTNGENITITIPTTSPTIWNETIGTTFDDGESARVTGYADGALTIELADEQFGLQVARVGIGDGGDSSSEFDVTERDSGGSGGGAYDVAWNMSRIDAENSRISCTANGCTFTATGVGDRATLTVESNPSVDDATVEYAVSERTIGQVDPGRGSIQGGEHQTELEAHDEGDVTVFASSGGTGDRLPVEIEFTDIEGFEVSIESTNSPVDDGEGLTVTATIENTGTEAESQGITFETGGQQRDETTETLQPGESTQVTLEWATEAGDAGEYTAVVASEDDDATTQVTVEDSSGPSIDSFTTEQRPGNNVGIRYSWSVSSNDAELDTVVVELYRDGTFVEEQRYTVSGQTADQNNEEFADLGDGQEYTLELTVTDVNEASETATRTQVAG